MLSTELLTSSKIPTLISPDNILQSNTFTRVNHSLKYTICKRFMFTRVKSITNKASTTNLISLKKNTYVSNNYSTKALLELKPNSNAAKDLASDEKGIHPHLVTETCTKPACEKVKCKILCASPQEMKTGGHLTHKPIVGKYSRFVSETDSNGKNISQYFTKNTDKSKKISSTKAQQYFKNRQIKRDPKLDQYLNKNEIQSKIDE